jgi:nucleotide-binding universal stress UspA family protein
MTDTDRIKAESEARRQTAASLHPTRFGEAINRYLGAANHPDRYAAARQTTTVSSASTGAETAPSSGMVVVGVDESPTSYIAVDHAAIEAELHGWALRIVTVRRSGKDEAGERLLARLTDRVHASAPATPVTSRLAVGPDPAQQLLTEAAGAGLLVVGHRHGAAATAFGRSVADRVARRHTGPVLVVRMPGRPVGADWGTRPIVVAVEDSAPSRAAVEFAFTEARARGCDVTMLHIAGDGTDLAHHLDTRTGVAVHHRIISGDPVVALLEASDRAAAVVIGRHGHGAVPGPLLAAAAHVLPQRAHCPVFLAG